MPIKQGDILLKATTVMDDVPEGGGAPTSTVIEDNESNAIFKDISESDRARGRMNMSKVVVSVDTPDTDTFLGANVIIARPPEDPNVSITAFTLDSVYDVRSEAQSRLEAYLNKGAEWPGFLYENHIAGQRTIQLFQRPGSEVPAVGKTLCLVQNEGLSSQKEQYIRATKVSIVERTFTYGTDTDYKAWIVTLDLSDVLRYDLTGTPANRQFQRATNATKTRDTVVADAGSYVGVTPLAEPITLGDFKLKATSIFSPLVPSAQVETPIVASAPYAQSGIPVRATHAVTYSSSQPWTTTTNLLLPGGCTPGSLSVVSGGITITDKAGTLMVVDQQVGTVDYANGILVLLTGSYSGAKQITYEPAGYAPRMPQSSDIPVTAEGRAQNYVGFISPLAEPGTLTISYQAQGRWYVLSDSGDGTLRGYDASYGAGTYNATTGDYVVTLGALPDVGSSIVLQWGVPTQEYAHPVASIPLSQTIKLETEASDMIDPTFMELTWSVDGVPKTATVNTAGVLSGDATGNVDVPNSEVKFTPNTTPVYGTEVTVAYDTGPRNETNLPHPSRDGQGNLSINAGGVNLVPGSVTVDWNTVTDMNIFGTYTRAQLIQMGVNFSDPLQTARDNGAGALVRNGVSIGTVNYTTGDIVFNPDVVIRVPNIRYSTQAIGGSVRATGSQLWRLNYAGINYVNTASVYPTDDSGYVNIKFYSATSATRRSQKFEYRPSFKLVPGVDAPVVPGTVVLNPSTGTPWGDSGTGTLQEPTAAGMVTRGTIDYVTGMVQMSAWPVGISGAVSRASTVTTLGENVSSAYVFRTASAPIRPGSLSIQYAAQGGGTQIVTANINGVISAAGVIGTVDYETGLVRVGFGAYVTAAGNESEPWYDASRVLQDGTIFKPQPVPASTVKYTAVAYSYLPLDADLIGVDPVRLPSDGRVPIFRAGSMVVVGNTKVTGPLTPSNGQTIDLARTRLSRAVVRDSTGKSVHTGYTVDLEAGTLTFTDVSGMATPVTIEDRIEDMLVAREVEISGDMSFTRPITHNYPVLGTYVSSALEFGDRKARVSLSFDQATWNGIEWADSPTSAVAPATYNTTLSPIEVTNAGASTERWGLWFTSATAFRIVGEHTGQIGTGDINTDCAPINPATGEPYFTVRALGWGTGWANGNVLRINTVGALCPVWVVRTTQPGIEAGIDYSFDLLTRGDVDRP